MSQKKRRKAARLLMRCSERELIVAASPILSDEAPCQEYVLVTGTDVSYSEQVPEATLGDCPPSIRGLDLMWPKPKG